jgi:hypothetical protein
VSAAQAQQEGVSYSTTLQVTFRYDSGRNRYFCIVTDESGHVRAWSEPLETLMEAKCVAAHFLIDRA